MNGITVPLLGRLPKDADPLKYTAQGTALLSLSVAVQDAKRGQDDATEWARITCWGDVAEQLDGRLSKGAEDPNINVPAVETYLMGVWDRGNSADFVSRYELDAQGNRVAPIPFAQFYRTT